MTYDRLNWFLTLAANVGVVLGLGFLVIELRHNTLATQATLNLGVLEYGRESVAPLLSDEQLADIVFRGEQDPQSLSQSERDRFLIFTSWRLGVWETIFMNVDDGVISDRYFHNFNAWYSRILHRGPGYKYWWNESRHAFDPAFRDHVDRIFESGK